MEKITIDQLTTKQLVQVQDALPVRICNIGPWNTRQYTDRKRGDSNVQKESSFRRLVLADPTGYIGGLQYAENEHMFRNANVLLTGFKFEENIVKIGKGTIIQRYKKVDVPTYDIPDSVWGPKNFRTINDLNNVITGNRVSVEATVTKVNCKDVTLKTGALAHIKELTLKDSTGECLVTLWQKIADFEVTVGSRLLVKNVKTIQNSYTGKMTVQVTELENMEILENIEEQKDKTIVIDGIDQRRGNVFLTDTSFNVFELPTSVFESTGFLVNNLPLPIEAKITYSIQTNFVHDIKIDN